MSGARSAQGDSDGVIELASDAPELFVDAVRSLREAAPRTEVRLREVPPPQRLAPWSFVYSAEVPLPDTEDDIATGRLVLLHDPQGQEAWDGTLRIVTYVTSEVDPEMAVDPLFGQVTWGWLIEALEQAHAPYTAAGGTVTRTVSTRFGDLSGPQDMCDVEMRASWTPKDEELGPHLRAWCDFICTTAGLPPPGVVMLHPPVGAA